MRRKIYSLLVTAMLLMAGKGFSQVPINGPGSVNTNEIGFYYADLSYDPCHYGYIDMQWIVDGGTILSQNVDQSMGQVYCQVQWTQGTGYSASIDLYGAHAPPPPGSPAYCFTGFPELLSHFPVMIGNVTITPLTQQV